jgi:hypothetical protein
VLADSNRRLRAAHRLSLRYASDLKTTYRRLEMTFLHSLRALAEALEARDAPVRSRVRRPRRSDGGTAPGSARAARDRGGGAHVRDGRGHFPITRSGSQRAIPGKSSRSVMQIAIPTMNGSTPIQRSTIVPALSPASSDTDLRIPWMM